MILGEVKNICTVVYNYLKFNNSSKKIFISSRLAKQNGYPAIPFVVSWSVSWPVTSCHQIKGYFSRF